MTTLQEAKQEEEWAIAGKLVSKLIFVKKRPRGLPSKIGLILVFIDIDGQPFEIKLWRDLGQYDQMRKIFTVYRKVDENNCYEISSTRPGLFFKAPKAEYSTAKLEYSRGWWINQIESNLRMNRYLDCSTNIQSSHSTLLQKKAVNIMGSYVSHKEGPVQHVVHGKPSIQGYFVTLLDDSGRMFIALVWHSVRIDRSKFSLFHCQRGDPVLLFSARIGFAPQSTSKDMISLTTIYQPVVNSKCVSPKRINALREASRSAREVAIDQYPAYARSAQAVA